jgi:pilus assembly protein CpaE
MAAEGILPDVIDDPDAAWISGAPRTMLLAFVNDATTENILRDGLSDATPETFDILRGGIRAAVTALQKTPTPRSLIVDISGEDEPLSALQALSQVVEPDVRVLVVGEIGNLDFYREVTRGMGAREYLPKPLTRDAVMRLFAPVIVGKQLGGDALNGGRVITITGARGGVGASTIAVNLAWHFGVACSRHTVLLDPDLHSGTAAMYVDAPTGPGLRAALEMPDRIDNLFIERAAQMLDGRLHVLAGQEPMAERPVYASDAAPRLLAALRRRYNFIVADVPFHPVPLYRDLLDLANQRVIVFEPTLAGIRDTVRLRAFYRNQAEAAPTVLLLNRAGMPGSLTVAQVEDALESRIDSVIPDLPKRLAAAANLGDPAARQRGFFRIRVQDLARLVAFNRLLDSASSLDTNRRSWQGKKSRWQIWKRQ